MFTRRNASGFSLLELLVVMAVIAFIAGLGFASFRFFRHRADLSASSSLVHAVATAIAVYPQREWRWTEAGVRKIGYLFDLNQDGLLDGDPILDANGPWYRAGGASFPATSGSGLATSGYSGFIAMTNPTIRRAYVSTEKRVIDAWKRPLRIAFALNTYGSSWFGVWSAGPDGVDGTADDLSSWSLNAAR